MQIIDIHTHVYPDKVAKKASDSIRDFYDIYGGQMDGTVEMLLERGKEAGISKYVILPVSNAANRVRSINNFILEQTAAHDCFIGFGTLHADLENLEEEAEWILLPKAVKLFCEDRITVKDQKVLIQGDVK